MYCTRIIGPRTQGQKLQKMLGEEENLKDAIQPGKGNASFINTGLCLEADRCVPKNACSILKLTMSSRNRLRKLIKANDKSPSDHQAISQARAKLSQDLGVWCKVQLQRFPKLRDHIPLVDFTTPEEEELKLPSAFTPEMRHLLGLAKLGNVEYNLREGQAHDALQSLRQVIQEFNYNLLDKRGNVHGVQATLRSESFLRLFTADKHAATAKYQVAREALISLGLSEGDSIWHPLLDTELWGKSVSKKRKLGDSKIRDPWFWSVVQPRGLSTEQQKEWSRDSM